MNTNKGFTPIIVVIIVAVIIAGGIGGYLYIKNKSSVQVFWTYKDEIDKFELELPQGWTEWKNFPDTEQTLAEKGMRKISFDNNEDNKWGRNKHVILLISQSGYEEVKEQSYLTYNKEKIKIDNFEAQKTTILEKNNNEFIGIKVYFNKGDKYFKFDFSSQEHNQKDLQLFDGIISSFHFF